MPVDDVISEVRLVFCSSTSICSMKSKQSSKSSSSEWVWLADFRAETRVGTEGIFIESAVVAARVSSGSKNQETSSKPKWQKDL